MSDFEPSLEKALADARTGARGVGRKQAVCTFCIVIAHAKPGAKEALVSASTGTISVRALHRALRASGIRLDRMSIQQHRNEGHTP